MYRQGVGRGWGTKLLCPSSAWHTPPHACVHQLVLDLCSGVFTELNLQWASQYPLLRLVKFQPFNHSIFLVSSSFLKLLGAPLYCHPKLLQHKLFCNGRGIMKDKRHYCHLEIPGILVALYQELRRKTKNLFLLQ